MAVQGGEGWETGAARTGEGPARDIARLRRRGFSEEACWDVLETAAMFNFTNRLAAGSGMRPNPEYRRIGRLTARQVR